jgi:S-formylglutathione hydrolase FrmB
VNRILLSLFTLGVCSGALLPAAAAAQDAAGRQARILDLKHYSHVFGEERNFRVFLPPGYDQAKEKRYPVIYFFHGFGERFNQTVSSGPGGYDTGYQGDNIASYAGKNDVIVVRWDGYNPRTPGEQYRRPYNVYPVETYRQFPLYFPELVKHIDGNFRTIPDREHRATSGLSMGGFMSFWVSGKYPQLVSSASNFMGSSEFFAGPNGFPSEYRHTEMYRNYEGLRTRIILGTKDFILWYHRRMNVIWDFTRAHHQHEEFNWEHGTPGIAKTFDFHMAAFRDPLPKPALWHHADLYPNFDVWGWSVSSDRGTPGFTALENVSASGFRSSVREWLPDGQLLPAVTLRISTDALYRPGASYEITDVNLDSGEARRIRQAADRHGRLHFGLGGARHEVGIAGTARPILAVAGWEVAGPPWATAGKPVRLKLSLVNKGSLAARSISAVASSPNPRVTFTQSRLSAPALEPGSRAPARQEIVFTVADPEREIVQLKLSMKAEMGGAAEIPIEVPLFRDAPEGTDFRVVDGAKLPLWERAVQRAEKTLGAGNGDGIANPGETVAIALPDGDGFRAAELFTSDPCADTTLRNVDPWAAYDHVGATGKITLALISGSCPDGHVIPFFARYQLPNKPLHVLKETVVRVRVTGRDRTPPEVRRARVAGWNRLEASLRDGGRIRAAMATLRNGEAVLKLLLNDEGREGDIAPGDGVFSGLLPNPAAGRYQLVVAAEDESGNSAERAVEGNFEFALPPPSPVFR